MATTAHLALTLVEQSQAQKEVTVNEALIRIDALLNSGALAKDISTPPPAPQPGDVYIVAAGATGAWAGHDGAIAYYAQGAWHLITPLEGVSLWVADEKRRYRFQGGSWLAEGLVVHPNGEFWRGTRSSVTVSNLSGTSVTTALQLPARSLVFAVHSHVTSAIGGASAFAVGDSSQHDLYGSGIGVALDSTNIGIVTPTPLFTDTDVTLTASGGAFSGGEVVLSAHYMEFRGPWHF